MKLRTIVAVLGACALVCAPAIAGMDTPRPETGRQDAVIDTPSDLTTEADLVVSTVDPTAVYYWRDRKGSVIGISGLGQIVYLEMPAGVVQKFLGPNEESGFSLDYAVGNGEIFTIYDVYTSSSDSFTPVSYAISSSPKSDTYPGRLITTPLHVKAVMRTTTGLIQLTNDIKWRPMTTDILLTMTWKNLSPATDITHFAPKLFIDVDAQASLISDMGTDTDVLNHFARSAHSMMVWNDPADPNTVGSPIGQQATAVILDALTPVSHVNVYAWDRCFYYHDFSCAEEDGMLYGDNQMFVGEGAVGFYFFDPATPGLAPKAKRINQVQISVQ